MKRLIAFILVLATMLLTMSACIEGHFSFDRNSEDDKYITRGEWAKTLGTYFGMDSCISDEPYFSDVTAENAFFAYVQSCTEWEIFDTSEKNFKPNEYATVSFIVETAVKASEIDQSGFSSAFEYAESEKIVEGKATDRATHEYAAKVADWAIKKYQNRAFKEYENIQLKDNVVVMADKTPDGNGRITLSESSVKVGDIIIANGSETEPGGVARKVTSVSQDSDGNYIIETVEPEIGEVYDDLDFGYVGTVEDASTIIPAEGVTVESVTDAAPDTIYAPGFFDFHITTLAKGGRSDLDAKHMAAKGKNINLSIKLSSGKKLSVSPSYNSIKADIEKGDDAEAKKIFEETGYAQIDDFKIDGDVQTIKATDKYTAGWELEGSVGLNNFYVETELEMKKAFGVPYGIKSFTYEVNYEVTSSIKFSGTFGEEISIATVPIPLGGLGITIDVEITAGVDVNGDIQFTSTIKNTSTVKYTEKSGFKKTQSSQAENDLKLTVGLKMSFGGKATLKALGIKLIDFSLKVGLGYETSAQIGKVIRREDGLYKYDGGVADLSGSTTEYILCVNALIYYPTVSLSLGTSKGTLANKLGIKITWKIMDKSGASFDSQKISEHYEIGRGKVDECILDTLQVFTEDDISEALEEDRNKESQLVGPEIMDISKYAVSLDVGESTELSVTTMPHGYTGGDIVWTSDDDSIVQVSGIKAGENTASCLLTAKGSGVTSVTVSTSNGEYSIRCSVIVKDDSIVDFNPVE